MVWQNNADPLTMALAENAEVVEMPRRYSIFDDHWTADTRWELGLPQFVRMEIPVLCSKHTYAKTGGAA